MERNSQKNGVVNLLVLLLAGAASYLAARYCNSLAGMVGTAFVGVGALIAGVSWFQTRLAERERLERLEFDELSRTASGSALFNVGEGDALPAQRSREQFDRYFVPVFTVILFILQVTAAVLFWQYLRKDLSSPVQNLELGMAYFAAQFLMLYLVGKFSTTIARLQNLHLLRPGSTYLLLSAYLSLIVAIGMAAVWGGWPKVDLYLARVLAVLLALVATETLINLILELYRPRVKGRIEHPVYESRVVSLLGQPEGLVTTAAQTLDYQFGFKVSETWFYQFFARAFVWLLLLQFVVLIFSSCFVFVDAGEQALLERFGKPVPGKGVLTAGVHGKFPWPIDKVYRYRTDQIQTFMIGAEPDPSEAASKVVLWTQNHMNEQKFLVANRDVDQNSATNNSPADADSVVHPPPPVSLLSISIPVQFQVTNLSAWAYNNEDPSQLLNYLATREVVRYLVTADLNEIMSVGRANTAAVLRDRIQAEADKHKLGASIVYVGLQDVHPPTKVAADYEKVVAANLTKEAMILQAQAVALRTNSMAEAQSSNIVSQAQSESLRRQADALAQVALFTNQIPAYQASPTVFMQRAYLEAFGRAVSGTRKYVVLSSNSQEVVWLNLEEKIPELFESVNIPPGKK